MDGLDDRWRKVKELLAWVAYHAGILSVVKKPPSYRKLLRGILPSKPLTAQQLGRKLDMAFQALSARYHSSEEGK